MANIKITHKNKEYGLIDISYKNIRLPVIMDWKDYTKIYDMNKIWKCNKYGNIYCTHVIDGMNKDVYMHDVIMHMKDLDEGNIANDAKILHINRLGIDNRRENLIYDTKKKLIGKNTKKKKRTVKLPPDSGIDVDDIPTYVWYMRPDSSHGDRFVVSIGDIKWKTTSSRRYDLNYKLDLAKDYLKKLKATRPDLFDTYSMNGDYNKKGKYLVNSFYDIIHKGGYDHIKRYDHKNYTEKLLY